MTLEGERCVACHKDAPRVEQTEQAELLAEIPGWDLIEINDVPRLQRTFKIKGWKAPVALANRIAASAEIEDHHPAITIEWGKVTVAWWTHAIRGLHRNDFIMAAKSNEIYDSL